MRNCVLIAAHPDYRRIRIKTSPANNLCLIYSLTDSVTRGVIWSGGRGHLPPNFSIFFAILKLICYFCIYLHYILPKLYTTRSLALGDTLYTTRSMALGDLPSG